MLLIADAAVAGTVQFDVGPEHRRVTLSAELDAPEGTGPFPAVVLLHGSAGPSHFWGNVWAERLVRWGYTALQVDSFGARGFAQGIKGSPFAVSPQTRAADAHAAKNYLAKLPNIDGERIAVMGMSHGGWAALASVENRNRNTPPRARPFRAAVALYPYCRTLLYGLDAPLLILIGGLDELTPAYRCEQMGLIGASAHRVTLRVYPDATHSFDVDRPDRYYGGHVLKYSPGASRDAQVRVKRFLDVHVNGLP
jgi:dienelactone hydrolase